VNRNQKEEEKTKQEKEENRKNRKTIDKRQTNDSPITIKAFLLLCHI
jgi:hypothetical protein